MVIIISKGYIWELHGQKPRITFTWEWNGVYRDSRKANFEYESKKKEKRRLIETKKCGCPFTLKGIKLLTNDD